MTVRTNRVATEPRLTARGETEMKLRHLGVAAVAEFADLLMSQQVTVRTAVRRMACNTTVDSGCGVLENEWPILGCVALGTACVVEAAELGLARSAVRIVAGCAGQRVFL